MQQPSPIRARTATRAALLPLRNADPLETRRSVISIKFQKTFLLLALLAAGALRAGAAEPAPKHRLLLFEYGKGPNRMLELDEDGKLVSEHKPPSIAVIFQVLPNGHLLYAYGGKPTGVREVTPQGEEVWNYVSHCPQVLGCDRMPNGHTLLAEQGPCRAVEVNAKSEVVQVTPLKTNQEGYHLQVRNIHKLANGNILAAHEGEGAVREVDLAGQVVWEYTGVDNAGDAQRLPNGNTLISCGTQKRIIEVTPDKKIAWEFSAGDAPELNLTWVSSIQQLKNGNLLVGNFLRGQEGMMLATGDMDDNVHMAGTLRVADALIKANKRFEFVMLPGKRHGYADATNFFFWTRADFFVKHLIGDHSQPVDILELTRERQLSGRTRAVGVTGPDEDEDQQ